MTAGLLPTLPLELQRHAAGGTVQTIVERLGECGQAVAGGPVHRYMVGDPREETRLRLEDEELVAPVPANG